MGTFRERSAINMGEDINLKEVLEKQTRHGLFCPDCHHHISRRVVLRERRRSVPRFCSATSIVVVSESDTSAIETEVHGDSESPLLTESQTWAIPINGCAMTTDGLSDFHITPEVNEFDILKSIVYGGLIESIASLVVISSAAGAGTSTLSTLALSLANLIGGLFILIHCLRELKNNPSFICARTDMEEDYYYQQLGRRQHSHLHATVAVIAFLVFGSIAPITYGFSFHKSDDRDHKLAVAAASSLLCIFLLALGKAHARRPGRSYIRTVLYYLMMGLVSSVISFLVSDLFSKLLSQLDLFESSLSSTSASAVFGKMVSPSGLGWASY